MSRGCLASKGMPYTKAMPPSGKPVFTAIVPKNKVATVDGKKIEGLLKDVLKAAHNRVTKYPSPPPASTYRRTGDYGRRWTPDGPKMVGGDLVAELGTNLEYASYVGGYNYPREPYQTKLHKQTGWASVETVMTEEWDKREKDIIEAIQGE